MVYQRVRLRKATSLSQKNREAVFVLVLREQAKT
jgi:hypothetical protein